MRTWTAVDDRTPAYIACWCTVLLLLLLAAAGCNAVSSKAILGAPDDVSDALNGTWVHEDEAFTVKHVGGGKLKIAATVWQGEEFVLSQTEAFATVLNDLQFINLRDERSTDEDPNYSFYLRQHPDDASTIILYPPNATYFKTAVEGGRLAGTVKKQQHHEGVVQLEGVSLQADKESLDAAITAEAVAQQFDFQSPIVLRRVVEGTR